MTLQITLECFARFARKRLPRFLSNSPMRSGEKDGFCADTVITKSSVPSGSWTGPLGTMDAVDCKK